jgi:hypothetical protein
MWSKYSFFFPLPFLHPNCCHLQLRFCSYHCFVFLRFIGIFCPALIWCGSRFLFLVDCGLLVIKKTFTVNLIFIYSSLCVISFPSVMSSPLISSTL